MIVFDPTHHSYHYGGKIIPGVTRILQATGFANYSGPWFDAKAKERGEKLHKYCELIDKGTIINNDEIDQDLKAGVLAYIKWKTKTGFIPILVETPLYSKIYNYAGTPDVFGQFPIGVYCVIDRKSGIAGPSTALQLAAYLQLIIEYVKGKDEIQIFPHQIERYALPKISTGRTLSMVQYSDTKKEVQLFLGLVAGFHWGVNNGVFKMEEAI